MDEVAMSPIKQIALGIGGCVLVPSGSVYKLKNGTQTQMVAVTVSLLRASLLRAEPTLCRLSESARMTCEEASALDYRRVRSYDDAVMLGLV
jgi:hypothetical protein